MRRQGILVDLEVRPKRCGWHVGGQHEQRRAGLRGLRKPRERVRKAWALVDAHDSYLTARSRVAVGHRDRPAFVPGGVECSALFVQCVRDCEVAATDEPEERLYPAVCQHSPDGFGD